MERYTIQRGDTLSTLAAAHHTSVRSLMRLNQLEDPHLIQAGATLKIPGDQLELSSKARQADSRIRSTDRPRKADPRDVRELAGVLRKEDLEPKSPFLRAILPAAQAVQEKYGLPAEVMLAQAAQESNWGRAAIGTYNVFGIKGSGSQGSIRVKTHEVVHGRRITVHANFAHYGSYEEAFDAYARTLHNGSYNKALKHKDDPVRFAKDLQGIYATDPHYSSRLIRLMRDEGLIT